MTIHKLLLTFCLFGITNANAALLNAELVVNGGAETGDTTGWTSTGIEAVKSGGTPARGFGDYTFTGAKGALTQTMSQTIDLSSNLAMIDNGELESIFNINLQSRSDARTNALDNAEAKVSFLDGSGTELDSVSFIDVTNTALFDWNLFSDSRLLSKGTRSIEILLTATRRLGTGISNDGFFEAVSLQLEDINPSPGLIPSPDPIPGPIPSEVPVPAAVWLFSSGILALFGRRKFKN